MAEFPAGSPIGRTAYRAVDVPPPSPDVVPLPPSPHPVPPQPDQPPEVIEPPSPEPGVPVREPEVQPVVGMRAARSWCH